MSMHAPHNRFEAGFAFLGLAKQTDHAYPGAHQFAQKFEKCSVLTDANIGYAANSSATSVSEAAKK